MAAAAAAASLRHARRGLGGLRLRPPMVSVASGSTVSCLCMRGHSAAARAAADTDAAAEAAENGFLAPPGVSF